MDYTGLLATTEVVDLAPLDLIQALSAGFYREQQLFVAVMIDKNEATGTDKWYTRDYRGEAWQVAEDAPRIPRDAQVFSRPPRQGQQAASCVLCRPLP